MSKIPEHIQPWTQPLFMVYDVNNDMRVPLTQERLDKMMVVEIAYGRLIMMIKDAHHDTVRSVGGMPKAWEDLEV